MSPETVRVADLVARAESAVRLSGTDPHLALAEAQAVLAEAQRGGPYGEAVSIALRASALAARELGDLALAEERLEEAIDAGSGFPQRVAQARMSLVPVKALLGDPEGGLRLADLAERDLTGSDLARLDIQRSVALTVLGRHRDAVRDCDRAIGVLGEDPKFQAGGLLNRGVARTYLEEYGLAEADLSECARIARAAGLHHVAMLAEGNLPFVAARRGDIAAAFERYRAAEATLFDYPERLAAMRTDFAEALVAGHLPGEARALLEQALPDLVASGAQASIPDARLLLAQAELLAGDARHARATAETALAELVEQGRAAWAPLATEVVLRARLACEPPDGESLAALVSCAAELAGKGWATASFALRLTTARTALRLGEPATARAQLDQVISSAARPVVRHHAQAMRLHLDGDLDGALEAARAGLEMAAGETATAAPVGDPELRALTARPAEELAALGVRAAVDSGDAWTVLMWAERWRAIVRGLPAPSPFGPGSLNHLTGSLVELVRNGDELAGVLAGARRCVLRPLGSYSAAREATVRIRYGLRRRNLQDATAADGLTRELAILDRRLLGPLDLDEGPVLIVPTGALHTLPWPLLPSLRGRPVSVAPEAASRFARRGRPRSSGDPLVVAVAGPGLRHASAEADMVVAAHPRARRIGATKKEVLGALEGADVLHVAAHGMFSPRSPMLSRIALDDGPLMAYDLLTAGRAPRLVVLSACDAGMAQVPVDGAALGLAGAFLDRGSACVVAGVVPVRDDEALTLMTVFHSFLAEGNSPAEALGAAAGKTGVSGFVCFGAGDEPLTARRQPVAMGLVGSVTQWDQEPT